MVPPDCRKRFVNHRFGRYAKIYNLKDKRAKIVAW